MLSIASYSLKGYFVIEGKLLNTGIQHRTGPKKAYCATLPCFCLKNYIGLAVWNVTRAKDPRISVKRMSFFFVKALWPSG